MASSSAKKKSKEERAAAFRAQYKELDPEPEIPEAEQITLENMHEWTDTFNKRSEMSSGNTACVYKGSLQDENKGTRAIKRLDKKTSDSIKKFWECEKTYLEVHQHQNIVKYYGSFECPDYYYLVFELLPHDLSAAMKGLNWEQSLNIFQGIAEAIQFVHQADLVHGDIKPQNILLDEEYVPKLCDFAGVGLQGTPASGLVTPGFCSRSYIAHNEKAQDVYAFGTTMLLMMTKKQSPLDNRNRHISTEQNLIVHNTLTDSGCSQVQAEKAIKLGKFCCSTRPTIEEVITKLNELKTPPPPPPLEAQASQSSRKSKKKK